MSATRNAEGFLGHISESEVERLRGSARNGLRHPVAVLALTKGPEQVKTNTEQAARAISRVNNSWLKEIKPRLVDTTDFTNASSALGEIRAYGALLEAGLTIKPGPKVTGKNVVPEFEVDASDVSVIVEVHSRQMDEQQRKAIEADHEQQRDSIEAAKAANPGKAFVSTSAIDVTPLGAPNPKKVGDSVLTNAISRICAIKAKERQSDTKKAFVLWLDLQDPTVWGLPISDEQLAPLWTSHDGHVESGALWYALYGRKGDPLMEMHGCDYRETAMLHDGRFEKTNQLSAVVYSLPSLTVVMEHPSPALSIPTALRSSMLRLPFFALDRSVCGWKPGLVQSYLDVQRQMVAAAAKVLVASNPA